MIKGIEQQLPITIILVINIGLLGTLTIELKECELMSSETLNTIEVKQ